MIYRVAAALLLLVSLLPAVGCDKATPVAPNGAILTISANPSQVGLNGRSTITVIGRKPDGQPLNPGTEIRLSVDKGTIDPTVVGVDDHGEATATFRANGVPGTAKVTAMTGGGMTMVSTDIQVGVPDTAKPTVLVSVTPSTLALEGTATVTVIARNADGTPVANGEKVTVTTTLGTLDNPAPTIRGGGGTATTTLNAGDREGTATVTAIYGSSAPATTTVMIVLDAATAISVTANPSSIPSTGGTIVVTATVTDSRAQAVAGALVTFQSELGKFEDNESETTDSRGQASKTLTVTQADIPASRSNFEVSAKTPSSTGSTFLEGTTTVTITRPSGGT